MGNRKALHHKGQHDTIARRITQAAKRNPNAVCAITGYTLDKCGPNRDGLAANGTRLTWDAGHRVDGDPRFGYQLECSYHNRSRGATAGNLKRIEPHSERW